MTDATYEDVLAALHDGQRFQIGGGRIFPTYAVCDGQLVVEWSDEGHVEQLPCDEATLRRAIAEAPGAFADLVRWWREGRGAP
ncbi:MAG: hypothetical protein IPH07_09875 [Deltaproteobacteria bacterium]|nr:hypothetical protein [Deltaproteobacteria bacterium]MBK8237043.1 hypothetical protein [Deltaproteobacteria bacterium]MBK8718745.1 hypothetical protein [Deltaproteobacteria bacterium]MBP7286453.1 hypothetical protein [Nannocystaceae bacterium]